MKEELTIRVAKPEDAKGLLEIYAPYVHSLFGHTEMLALGAVVALSQLQSFGATLMRHGCAFNTSHGNISFYTVTLSQVRK